MAERDLIARAAAAVGIDPAAVYSVTISDAGDVVVLDNQLRKWRLAAEAVGVSAGAGDSAAAEPTEQAGAEPDAQASVAAARPAVSKPRRSSSRS